MFLLSTEEKRCSFKDINVFYLTSVPGSYVQHPVCPPGAATGSTDHYNASYFIIGKSVGFVSRVILILSILRVLLQTP